MTTTEAPLLPNYAGACTMNVVPELINHVMAKEVAAWMPKSLADARQVILLVLDGLGWEQLESHRSLVPVLANFDGGPITTVAPTTTSVALTSIVTGRTPADHGIFGQRMSVDKDVLDILKWRTSDGDARKSILPTEFQTQPAFQGRSVPVVTRRHFVGTGFTDAHLSGTRIHGYSVASSLPVEICRLAKEGEPLIYGYYEGVDTVSHMDGMGDRYRAELRAVNALLDDIVSGLPSGAALVVTSDHGQVQVGERIIDLDADITDLCHRYSGEGRFRWLHANDGSADALIDRCRNHYSDLAWVKTREEIFDEGWFGRILDERAFARLGDVALVASEPVAFRDPTHHGETNMQCRHGSLTPGEIMVPLLALCNE